MKNTITAFAIACLLAGFAFHDSANAAIDARTGASELVEDYGTDNIRYTVAKNYFVNNSLDSLPPVKITDEAIFNECFGMSTAMGKDGQPTAIDFSSQYVIAVTLPVTDTMTVLKPKRLVKGSDGRLTFSYVVKRSKKMTYTMQPLLLVIVDKKHDGEVVLNAISR